MFEVKRSIICKKRKQKSDNFLTTVPPPISCFISFWCISAHFHFQVQEPEFELFNLRFVIVGIWSRIEGPL